MNTIRIGNYFLLPVLISCLTIQAMQQLPPPYELHQSSSENNPMTIIDMSLLPEYAEREAPHSRRCAARFKRNMAFGTAATVLGGLGI